ncbi:fasciclin domain-containing protein [Parapedobacter tibetensis]|nr:fasciclin domain-containing protein [Parapedobacter tibetensis]
MDKLKIQNSLSRYLAIATLVLSVSACTFMGLDLQEDHKHKVTILEPDIHMTAWEFINKPLEDTLRSFELIRDAVVYAGLEEEYSKPGRTFLVFNNQSVLRYDSNGAVNSGCYFGREGVPELDENGDPVLDSLGQPITCPGRNWEDYPVEQIRNLLLYHIVEGEYSYHNLGPDNTIAQSLSPVDTANKVHLRIENDRNAKLRVNDFHGTIQSSIARTANLKATNGFIHVFDTYQRYGVQ